MTPRREPCGPSRHRHRQHRRRSPSRHLTLRRPTETGGSHQRGRTARAVALEEREPCGWGSSFNATARAANRDASEDRLATFGEDEPLRGATTIAAVWLTLASLSIARVSASTFLSFRGIFARGRQSVFVEEYTDTTATCPPASLSRGSDMLVQSPSAPSLQLITNDFASDGRCRNDHMHMIRPAIHPVQSPTPFLSMFFDRRFHDRTLGKIQINRLEVQTIPTPSLQPWSRRLIAAVPADPTSLITWEPRPVTSPRQEEPQRFTVHQFAPSPVRSIEVIMI